jgi:hypothetical protein
MDLAAKKAFELKMANKLAELQGREVAPAEAPAAEPTPDAPPVQPEPEPVAAPDTPAEVEPEAPEVPSDEWHELKQEFGSAKAAREALENQRAMVAESHQRNAEAARERQEARMLFEQTRALQNQLNAQTQALAQMGEADPQAGIQLLSAMAKRSPAQQQVDPIVSTLTARLDQMDQAMAQQRFTTNQAITVQAAHEAVRNSEVLSELAKANPALAQEAAQEVVQKLYDRDMRTPGTVVPTNSATFAPVVAEALRAIEKKYRSIGDAKVSSWKKTHEINGKKAPPSSKGPSASARTAPPTTKAPPNMTMRARGDWLEKQIKAKLESLKDSV